MSDVLTIEAESEADLDVDPITGLRTFRPWKRFNASYVPEVVEMDRDLSPMAKLVYGRLARYYGQSGDAWPSHKTLAASLGTNVSRVRRALTELREREWIDWDCRAKKGQTNIYYFLWKPEMLEYDRFDEDDQMWALRAPHLRETHDDPWWV